MSLSLIEAHDLQAMLAAGTRPVQLVNVCSPDSHAAGHPPGARHLSPAALMHGQPPAPGALPAPARLQALLDWLAVSPDTLVVAMDDEGGGWAGRLLWTLTVLGHPALAALDGGSRAWAAAGLPLATGSDPDDQLPSAPSSPPTGGLALDAAPVVSAETVLAGLDSADQVVWDCRSAAEYSGQRQTAARAGHIPGAVHLDWLELMDPDRDLRLRTDAAALLAARGITPDKQVVVHCQSHHRSALAWLAASLLGYPRVAAYAGSWAEWGNRPDLPVVSGPAPGTLAAATDPGVSGG